METLTRAKALKPKKDKKKRRERKPAPLPRSVRALLGYLGGSDAKIGGAVRGATAPAQQQQTPTVNIRFELPPQMKQQAPEVPQFFQQEKYRKPTSVTPSPLQALRGFQQPQPQQQQPIIIQQQPIPLPKMPDIGGLTERVSQAEQGLLQSRIQQQMFMAGGYELAQASARQQQEIENIKRLTKRGYQGLDDDEFDNVEYVANPVWSEGGMTLRELPTPKEGQWVAPDVGMDVAEEYLKKVSSKPITQRQEPFGSAPVRRLKKTVPEEVLEKRTKKFQVVIEPPKVVTPKPKIKFNIVPSLKKPPTEGLILEGQEKEFAPVLQQPPSFKTPQAMSAQEAYPKAPSPPAQKTTKELKPLLAEYFTEVPKFKRGQGAAQQRGRAESILEDASLTPAEKSAQLQELFKK
jgi:hypothetical protein